LTKEIIGTQGIIIGISQKDLDNTKGHMKVEAIKEQTKNLQNRINNYRRIIKRANIQLVVAELRTNKENKKRQKQIETFIQEYLLLSNKQRAQTS